MSIQEHLNKIRNAVYGREVRESIAKGIETAYDDASENGNANMEVKLARGANPNLNARLNKMEEVDRQTTAQLAQKITKGQGDVEEQDLSQGVKEIINGDRPLPIAEVDSILEENIVDGQVSYSKLDDVIKKTKFKKIENLSPPLLLSNWNLADGTNAVDTNYGIDMRTAPNSSFPFARIWTYLGGTFSIGDTLFIRVDKRVLNNDSAMLRVLIRNGSQNYIHLDKRIDVPDTNQNVFYFTHKIEVEPENLTIMVDTLYSNVLEVKTTEVYGVSVYKINDLVNGKYPISAEKINKATYQTDDLFTADFVLDEIGELKSNIVDYNFPQRLTWGHEYLHAWYSDLHNNRDVKIVWGGDSTTANTTISNEAFHRNNLGKKILVLGGYDEAKITSLNHGHGGHHTGDWLETHLDNDLAENPDLYVLGYGLNDGGTNYFPGTTVKERVEGFENRLREGLGRIRSTRSADSLPIIITMPVTTNNPEYGRDKDQWHNHIRPIIQRACRDFQCAFADLAAYHYDRTNSSSWSVSGDNVHPNSVATVDYMSVLKDLLMPYLFQN